MKRLVLISSLLLTLGLASRAETNYLHVATENGWEVVDLNQADRLTFKGGTMTVLDASDNTIATFPQSTLDRMYIDQNTGVGEIVSDTKDATFQVSDNGRTVKLFGAGTFEVFTLDGMRIIEIPDVVSGKEIELSGLRPGVYVFRLGGYSVKRSIN